MRLLLYYNITLFLKIPIARIILMFILETSGSQPGVRVSLGVLREAHRGCAKLIKTAQKKPFWVEFLIWGYAKGIQFWFGGTQRGAILIWGYAGTKRLRTPALDSCHLDSLHSCYLGIILFKITNVCKYEWTCTAEKILT